VLEKQAGTDFKKEWLLRIVEIREKKASSFLHKNSQDSGVGRSNPEVTTVNWQRTPFTA
jgi:hypothetical protein